jgi:hypothetical protein
VLGRVVGCAFFVAYDPYVTSMACTMLRPWLLLWPNLCGASMIWTMCLPTLVSVIVYACFYNTFMGHNAWYLVTCNDLSIDLGRLPLVC